MNGLPEVEHQVLTAAEVRPIVWSRCMAHCELCGEPLRQEDWQAHHRQRRGRGTPDWCPCNVLGLHPACHNMHRDSVHDNVARSRASGHLVSRYAEPAHVPVDLPLGVRIGLSNPVTLTCGGTYQ